MHNLKWALVIIKIQWMCLVNKSISYTCLCWIETVVKFYIEKYVPIHMHTHNHRHKHTDKQRKDGSFSDPSMKPLYVLVLNSRDRWDIQTNEECRYRLYFQVLEKVPAELNLFKYLKI